MFCREQVAQLRDEIGDLEAQGKSLIVVGPGSPAQARDFKQKFQVDYPLYVDPGLGVYKEAALKRRLSMSMKVLKNGARALKNGHIQGRNQGDVFQLGGVFVLGPGEQEHYAYASKEAGDHPPPQAVLDVLTNLN